MTETSRPVAAIVLAAGKGTRMKSSLHKVLHPIAGRPMLDHLLASVAKLQPERTVIVSGHGREQIATSCGDRATIAVQDPQIVTGHAVQHDDVPFEALERRLRLLYGDVPFVAHSTMRRMLDRLADSDNPAAVVLAFKAADPGAYGRVISVDGQTIVKMVEYKDASDAERQVDLCNSGMMAVRAEDLFGLLARVGNDNAAGEYYLPDIVKIAAQDGRKSKYIETHESEVRGINSRAELAAAERQWQEFRREEAMAQGASLVAPETVFFSYDTELGEDVTIEPNVVFGPGVKVAGGATIHAFCHLQGCEVGEGASVGPFARLRPGAKLARGAKVGNFVEIKNAGLGEGAKVNHLSYVGDAQVGAGANIGAGTITCNYDGYFKHQTVIGERAFIGSNSALIAPVNIGADAIVAAGSAVSRDVAAGELRMVRAEQLVKPGWADRFHDAMKKKKAEAKAKK